MKNAYFVILSGGGGERLWPLSRRSRPKQFLKFLDSRTLLEHTIDRIYTLAYGKKNIYIITNQNHVDLIHPLVKRKVGYILSESDARNTGPAILYSCLKLSEKNPDAIVTFLPADSFVLQGEAYREYLKIAIEYASVNNRIVTLGVMPTKPLTCYGYIQALKGKDNVVESGKVYDVLQFCEKPNINLAQQYFIQDDMFWNIGVFVAKVSVLIKEFEKQSPDIFNAMQDYINNKIEYKDIPSISIDYAVMEKSENISILPCVLQWSDIGNLDVFLSFKHQLSKDKSLDVIQVDSENNLVEIDKTKKKLIVFVGIKDICFIENEDVVLVAKRDQVDNVKKVLNKLKQNCLENFL
ncbi:NTP transferase domain-containing protein [Candidatus Dependentiae bacterium]|nr:NTP transferase domain-containing protein [Candidatus Dependentiae bacterium]